MTALFVSVDVIFLFISCLIFGFALSSLDRYHPLSTKLLVGYAVLIIACSVPVRLSLTGFYALGCAVVVVIQIFTVFYCLDNRNIRTKILCNSSDISKYAIIIIITLAIYSVPSIITGSIIEHNKGPDLDGHALSAAYVSAGGTVHELIANFSSLTSGNWMSDSSAWIFPDWRQAVAYEFLLRSNRFAHVGLVNLLSNLLPNHSYLHLYSVQLFSLLLFAIYIFDKIKRLGKLSIFIVAALLMSQTFLVMRYEGIVAQLIAVPITTFLLLEAINIFKRGNKFVYLYALILSALISLFGEGAQIVGVCLILIAIATFVSDYMSHCRNLDWRNRYRVLLVLTFICAFLASFDISGLTHFFEWSIYRLKSGFSGGALHLDWNFFDILMNVPSVSVPDFGYIKIFHLEYIALFVCFLAIMLLLRSLNKSIAIVTLSTAIVLFIVYVLDHKYALWKTSAIFFPVLMIIPYLNISHVNINRHRIIRLLVYTYASVGFILSLYGYITLAAGYVKFSRPIQLGYDNVSGIPDKPFLFVSDENDGFLYHKIGDFTTLSWVNSGWGQDYSIKEYNQLPLYGVYVCNYPTIRYVFEMLAPSLSDVTKNVTGSTLQSDAVHIWKNKNPCK